jgi:hypothetical protein
MEGGRSWGARDTVACSVQVCEDCFMKMVDLAGVLVMMMIVVDRERS